MSESASNPFSQPWTLTRRTVMFMSLIAVLPAVEPQSTSESWIVSRGFAGLRARAFQAVPMHFALLFFTVTPVALTTMQPVTFFASTIALSTLTVRSPLTVVSDVPAGTPVVDASGNPVGGGVGVGVGVAVGVGEGVGVGLGVGVGVAAASA